jgi:cob(I)alamin adenosyltransferase
MRLTKIYTKVGDKGYTHLGTGKKVIKSSLRVDTYGTVDELNAWIGFLVDELPSSLIKDYQSSIRRIQNELFDIGAELSLPDFDMTKLQKIEHEHIERLELQIDTMNVDLAPLENFVLPGGSRSQSICHIARTVCRRAERKAVELHSIEVLRNELIMYLNRLSDWLFVFSRFLAHKTNTPEILWQQKQKS